MLSVDDAATDRAVEESIIAQYYGAVIKSVDNRAARPQIVSFLVIVYVIFLAGAFDASIHFPN